MLGRVHLAVIGDANSPIAWSGIPYHLLQTARRMGLLDEGLRLSTDAARWRMRRFLWNFDVVLRGNRLGGYQYSDAFLERLWAPVRRSIERGVVVNCFQLYPSSIVADAGIERWYYIDMTLRQLFDDYGNRGRIGRSIATNALEREREGYLAARGVIAHSEWAAESLRAEYGVPPDRVHVAVPGANLDPAAYERWEHEAKGPMPPSDPPRLVFVGKDWRRKGLDRLLAAVALARPLGLRATLLVVGCPPGRVPRALRRTTGVEWIGFLDKRREADRFLTTVASADLGCLLSTAEAGGMALREYAALGLAILGPRTGGAPQHAAPAPAILVDPDAPPERIARILLDLESDPERLANMKRASWASRHEASWDTTVRGILEFWPHERSG